MLFVVRCLSCIVYRLFVVCCFVVCVVCWLLFSRLSCVFFCAMRVGYCLLFNACGLPVVVKLLFVVCCLLFVGGCWLSVCC